MKIAAVMADAFDGAWNLVKERKFQLGGVMEGRMGVPEEEPMVDTAVSVDESDHCCEKVRQEFKDFLIWASSKGDKNAETINWLVDRVSCEELYALMEKMAHTHPRAREFLESWDKCSEENNMLERSNDSFEDAWIMAKSVEFPETIVTLYSGMGGVEQGAKMVGLPTAYSGEMWADAMRVNHANHPEGVHDDVEFGKGEYGSVPAVAERILQAVGNKKYHLHGSPPCQGESAANRFSNAYTGRDDGMEQVRWYGDLVQFLQMSENPPVSWTMEETPRTADRIRDAEYMSDEFKRLAADTPLVYAKDHGLPQTRGRIFMGKHGDKDIIIPPSTDKPLTIRDVFPYAEQQFIDNTSRRNRMLDLMAERFPDAIDSQEKREFLRNTPLVNLGDAINPGRGGAEWKEGGGNFTFKHLYDLDRIGHSLTGKRPTFPYDRKFTNEELARYQGFDDYDLSPPGGKINLIDMAQMFGNSVPPPVAAAMFRHIMGAS